MNQKLIMTGAGALVAFIAVMLVVQRSCDRAGMWPRREETRVYTGGSWPEGEERKCLALPRADGTIYFLGCVDGIQNSDEATPMTVTFWGKTQRPDRFEALQSNSMEAWHWRCRSGGSSLTCYAVN